VSGVAAIARVDGGVADPALLRRMMDVLAHRGPDGEGDWVSGPVALGHRLLAAVPGGERDKQPVTDRDGEHWLVWDGRLDDRASLIAALGADAAPLSDAELVLADLARRGADALPALTGDFALVHWDGRARTLRCACDPIGVRPLYYHWDGRRLLVASEIAALLADPGVARRPDEATIADYLLMGFRDARRTFFDGIRRLPGGHRLRLERSGPVVERYAAPGAWPGAAYADEREWLEVFRDVFTEAVRCRLRAAGPLGALLSGGIDSTIVTATAEWLRRGRRGPDLHAFTLVLEASPAEDREALDALAAAYGTAPRLIAPGDAVGPPAQEALLECGETPHHDAMPTAPLLLAAARSAGCRAVLTGFGADELAQSAEDGFLADLLRGGRWRRLAHELRNNLDAYGGGDRGRALAMLAWLELPPRVRRGVKRLLGRQRPAWIDRGFARRVDIARWLPPARAARCATRCAQATAAAVSGPSMAFALAQMDAVAAAFSIDVRHPFLDRRVVDLFLAVPSAVKLAGGHRKQFLQRAMVGVVPGAPRRVESPEWWMPPRARAARAAADGPRLAAALHPGAAVFRYVDRGAVDRLRAAYAAGDDRPRVLLWHLAKLERWLERWFGAP